MDKNFGGKAASLKELTKAGFPVPEFIVLTTDVYRNWKQTGSVSFPADLEKVLEPFTDKKVAVRSSASKEDGTSFSFAGIFETYLDINGMDGIKKAILDCWKSLQSERVFKYCERNQIDPLDLEMAVVIQEYIDPDFAGVMFTVNPITGNDREIIIEACPGSGEKLVSGLVTPSSFILNRERKNIISKADDKMQIHPSEEVLRALRDYAFRIAAYYGKPQDIEFAVKANKIFILQSRPITKIQFSKDMGEWTTSDFRDGGVSSAVVSPIMWSLYKSIFATSLPDYFVKLKLITKEKADKVSWYKVFYGRPYWNLRAVKDIQEELPGYNERNFDTDMALPINYEGDGVTTGFSIKGILKALPVLKALHKEYEEQKVRSQTLVKNFKSIEAVYTNKKLSSLTDKDLHQSFKDLVEKDFFHTETEYFNTIYNASNAKLEFNDEFKIYKKADPTLDLTKLFSGLGNLKVTAPAYAIALMARNITDRERTIAQLEKLLMEERFINPADLAFDQELQRSLSEFQSSYYHHSERELDLLIPRWGEDLKFCLEILLSILKSNSAAETRITDPGDDLYINELFKLKMAHKSTLRRWIPGKWNEVESKLKRVREYLWLREEVRDCSTRIYCFIRLHLMEIGHRTGLRELIFYCSFQDVIAFINGEISLEELKARADDNRLYALSFVKYKNSNEIGFRFNNSSWKAKAKTVNGKTSYYGIGCSSGVLVGTARVIKDISEASRLNKGEIMIVPYTDPGWTPLFSLAAGIVTETGGLLSHAALISREYGIPCVLNVNGALEQIKDGSKIEIDGNEGRVTIL